MSINETDDNQPFDSLNNFSEEPQQTCQTTTQRAYVLEEIEESDELRDRPVCIICPNCSSKVETYFGGLPDFVSYFKNQCSECAIELRRWCAVAVDAAYVDTISSDVLADLTRQYWNTHLWKGVKTAEGCPRNREFTRLYAKKAVEFGWDWRVSCPLCRRSVNEMDIDFLDYHHWQHEPDRGVCLCRECHDEINGGECDFDVDWTARTLGLRNKHDLQIIYLAQRESKFQPAASLDELASRLVRRYNLIQSPQTVRDILEQSRRNDEIKAVSGAIMGGQ